MHHEKIMAIAHFVIQFPICTGTVPHNRLQQVVVQGGRSCRANGNKKASPEKERPPTLFPLPSMAGKQSEEMRNLWIDCYMSVSYPLKEIIVTSPFGRRKDPFTGKRRIHNGLDLRARNEEVYAMMSGEVVKVSSDKAFR